MITILFLCPHGAAKSVLAAAAFRRRAERRGLPWRVASAGTDPDPSVAPAVAAFLRQEGLPGAGTLPRRVTARDIAQADYVISLGCGRADLPAQPQQWQVWTVPAPSQGVPEAWEAICRHVERFLDDHSV